MKSLIILCLTSCVLFFTGCEKNSTAIKNQPEIQLTSIDEPYLRQISLNISLVNIDLPQILLITRNQVEITSLQMNQMDTTVIDTGLTPSSEYTYQVFLIQNLQKTLSSPPLTVATLDTTSHNFNWDIFYFGDGNGSGLRDVAVINEDNIWAVGNIQVQDSTGSWISYNAVHWDGQHWELTRIQVFYHGNYITPSLEGIFAFSENDIWVTSGVPMHWNGNTWTLYHLWDMGVLEQEDGGVTNIWGPSPTDIYFVGRKGTIVHHNGSSWQKMYSGTDVELLDVWGTPVGSAVWSCGTEVSKPTVLLRRTNGILEIIYEDTDYLFQVREDTLSGRLVSGWGMNNRNYYVLSSMGLYKLSVFANEPIQRLSFMPSLFPGFPRRVRGNGPNDLIIVGDIFMIAHYNGSTWEYYDQFSGQGRFWSVDQKDNIVCAVGTLYDLFSKGIILVGKR